MARPSKPTVARRDARAFQPVRAVTYPRVAELASCRAEMAFDDRVCLILFGVGLTTLERIESGEVEPAPDVAARLDRFLLAPQLGDYLGFQPGRLEFPQTGPTGGGLGGSRTVGDSPLGRRHAGPPPPLGDASKASSTGACPRGHR